jgi:hypothetical protein
MPNSVNQLSQIRRYVTLGVVGVMSVVVLIVFMSFIVGGGSSRKDNSSQSVRLVEPEEVSVFDSGKDSNPPDNTDDSVEEAPKEESKDTTLFKNVSDSSVTPAKVIKLNGFWNQYISEDRLFSFNFPRDISSPYGGCNWVDNGYEKSYRNFPDRIPLKVIDDPETGSAYLTTAYYYALENGVEIEEKTSYSSCSKVDITLEMLKDRKFKQKHFWEWHSSTVSNDDELTVAIKDKYGSRCDIGPKISTGLETYDITVLGDGKGYWLSECFVGPKVAVKYSEALNFMVAVDVGKEHMFTREPTYSTSYDTEILDSFRFLR